MTATELDTVLKLLGAVRNGGSVVAACPLHQQGCDRPGEFKLNIEPGTKYPILFRCWTCCPPGQPGRWRSYTRELWEQTGLDAGLLYTRMAAAEIDRVWRESGWSAGGSAESPPAAEPDVLDRCYAALLERCPLTDRDRAWLAKKGLPNPVGYGSTPAELEPVVAALWSQHGAVLAKVPGFVNPFGPDQTRLLLRDRAILTPCRNRFGQVVAIKQRLPADAAKGKKSRMRLLSSAFHGGPKAVNQCHVPLGVGGRRWDRLWVTEGERKADVFWQQRREPVVALPGVGARVGLPTLLRELLEPDGEVVLALDTDPAGVAATESLRDSLDWPLSVARWEHVKGLDDAVTAGREVRLERVERIATHSQLDPSESKSTVKVPAKAKSEYLAIEPGTGVDRLVQWLTERGPTLRSTVPFLAQTVTKAIYAKRIAMTKTRAGQILSPLDADWKTVIAAVKAAEANM